MERPGQHGTRQTKRLPPSQLFDSFIGITHCRFAADFECIGSLMGSHIRASGKSLQDISRLNMLTTTATKFHKFAKAVFGLRVKLPALSQQPGRMFGVVESAAGLPRPTTRSR